MSPKKDMRGYKNIEDGFLLSKDDFFEDPTSDIGLKKQVLYEDKFNVYSYIKDKSGKDFIIKPYSRESIKKGWINTFAKMTLEEKESIEKEFKNIGHSSAKLSSFKNSNIAKDGDYLTFLFNDKRVFGKVIDHTIGKIMFINNITIESKNLSEIKDPLFFTSRDISSPYSNSILRANNYKILYLTEEEAKESGKNYVEAIYTIPINKNPEYLTLLEGEYAEIGKYQEASYSVSSDQKDVTDYMLNLRKNAGKEYKNLKPYVEKNNQIIQRNLDGLHEIYGFNSLSMQSKKNLDILQPGVYFKVYGTLGNNIYRIMEVEKDKVIAQVNKMNYSGDMLTFEEEFLIDDLFAVKPEGQKDYNIGSIKNIYLQTANKKFNAVIKEIKENTTVSENTAAMNRLVNKMSEKFKSIGVEVIQTRDSKIFSNNETQKAKIETALIEGEIKTTIYLNQAKGSINDLVHETLHVYLTALRYYSEEIYNNLLSSVLKDTGKDNLNVTDREEAFVKIVSDKVEKGEELLVDNLKDFIKVINIAVGIVSPEFEGDEDIFELLKKPLHEVFNLDLNNNHKMFNLSMITTEPRFREWMKENEIMLNCN